MNLETTQALRCWHSAGINREERVHYDRGAGRWHVRLEEQGRTVATGKARERDEAFARAAAMLPADEPRRNRRTAIDPVTELAAARAWLEAIASSGTSRPAERNYARTIIAAVDVRGGPGVLGMRAAEWLGNKADSRHPMHSRWARAVLTALETPRNRLAVVR